MQIKSAVLIFLTMFCLSGSCFAADKTIEGEIYAPNATPAAKAHKPFAQVAFAKAAKGDFEGGALMLDKCIDPANWTSSAMVSAARIYEQAGRMSKATDILDGYIKKGEVAPIQEPGVLALALRFRGDCAKDMGQPDDAVRLYVRSADVCNNAEMQLAALKAAARVRRSQKRNADALALLDKVSAQGAKDIWWHSEHATVLVELAKPAQAISDLDYTIKALQLRRASKADSNTHQLMQAYQQRAKCYEKTHQMALANADHKAVKDLGQSWEEDLFGGGDK